MSNIHVRAIVKFKSKHKDESILIVREIRSDGKVLIESLKNKYNYLVPISDIEIA